MLHVVTAYSNPMRSRNREALHRRFVDHMLKSGVDLTVVECAFGNLPHAMGDPRVRHVPVRARALSWTKENLINLGIARLPADWNYVAWIDGDVTFRRTDWVDATVHALNLHDVVQPWSDCYDLGPNGEHLATHRSFARQVRDGCRLTPGYGAFAHPGYAWAATRAALEWVGGLIETAALGAGDHHMAMSLVGQWQLSMPGDMTDGYTAPVRQWQARALHHMPARLGVVAGTIEHGWHGPKRRRRYVERWDVLRRHRFDPATDLKRNTSGVLELAGNKPRLAFDIAAYFRARDEDCNDLTGEL
jgi:hypothetical protein